MKIDLTPYDHSELLASGRLFTFVTEMTPYEDRRMRRIRIWLPDEYDGVRRFPVIYMQDGQNVFGKRKDRDTLEIDHALTSLRDSGISAIVVAIDTDEVLRLTELTPPYKFKTVSEKVNGVDTPVFDIVSTTATYSEFIVRYLKPMIDENFITLPDMENTFVGGISAGASASYYMLLRFPEIFGRAIVCSPGFPVFPTESLLKMLDEYDISRLDGHRIALYNGDQTLDATSLDPVIAVYKKLRELGMDETRNMLIVDTRQSHCEKAWAKYMPELLYFLFTGNR